MRKALLIAIVWGVALCGFAAPSMAQAPRFVLPYQTVIDSTGIPLNGALLYFYASGTTTPLDTYSDVNLTTPNTNPVVANSAGVFPNIFLANAAYKVVLTDSSNNQIWTADPVGSPTPDLTSVPTVTNIAALKALTGGVYTAVFVQGYTNVGDLGAGYFVWNNTSVANDNAGTIIAPTGGGTGRWIRFGTNGGGSPVYTPEMFGSPDDGTDDDALAIRAAMLALNTVGGGTLQLACNTTYHLSSVGSNHAVINIYSGVSIRGCGANSVLKVANGVSTSGNYYSVLWPSVSTDPINNVTYSDFTIDANGANNDCSGGCYGNATSLGFEYGDAISIRGMTFLNQAMTQFLELGSNSVIPTLTNINIVGNSFEDACDAINAACTDHSSIYLYASNGTVVGNTFYNGGNAHGGAIELHGYSLAATGNVIDSYFGAFVPAANDGINTGVSENISITGNSAFNVALLAHVFTDSGGTFENLIISNNTVLISTVGGSWYAIEASNDVNPSGTSTNLSVSGNTIFGYTGSGGIHLGTWSTATVADNHFNNGAIGIRIDGNAGTAGFVFGNTLENTSSSAISLGSSHANWNVGCTASSATSFVQGTGYC